MPGTLHPRKSHSQEWLFYVCAGLLAVCVGLLAGCGDSRKVYRLEGGTMGTTWHATVIVPGDDPLSESEALAGIQQNLDAVNASMSTYRKDSEISRFNEAPENQWFDVSADFYTVLTAALQIGNASGGAYDVTVGPLVNLWGFGPGPDVEEPPSAERIAEVKQRVGQDKLEVDPQQHRLRKTDEVYLDFSSIAKGFAVDKAADWLEAQGVGNYLLEVGGEMRLAGKSPRGDDWRVAVELPDSDHFGVAREIRPGTTGVATSGDYRNFFEVNGVRYSHSIDPRTGYPVEHELVSVSVVHPSTMMADAWATALTVLGPEKAWSVAQAQGLAVYFIQRDGDGFSSRYTDAFEPFLSPQSKQQP